MSGVWGYSIKYLEEAGVLFVGVTLLLLIIDLYYFNTGFGLGNSLDN